MHIFVFIRKPIPYGNVVYSHGTSCYAEWIGAESGSKLEHGVKDGKTGLHVELALALKY